ncbi:TPA: hypothetical protein IHJ63_004561 [Escherichia coli]|nr:hypothetical protein [Escherichia coli]HAO1996010.1 hypothetical protein [Escherichia coli]HAO2028999.1 hypothetical protein [Escherichia coli]
MKLEHWAIPITSLDGMLLGVELETRVLINGCQVLMGAGKESEYIRHVVYQNQLRMIQGKAAWFKEKGLLCVLSTGTGTRYEDLPFIRYMAAEPLLTNGYDLVRLNRRFTEEHIERLIFPVLINNIMQYCDKVIVQVSSKRNHRILRESGVWAVQGEYRPIRFEQCEQLL